MGWVGTGQKVKLELDPGASESVRIIQCGSRIKDPVIRVWPFEEASYTVDILFDDIVKRTVTRDGQKEFDIFRFEGVFPANLNNGGGPMIWAKITSNEAVAKRVFRVTGDWEISVPDGR